MSDGPTGVIWRVEESSAVNLVSFVFQRLVRWNDPVVSESTGDGRTAKPRDGAIIQAIGEQTIDLLTTQALRIDGTRADTAVQGDATLTYQVPGMLWVTTDDGVTLQAVELADYVTGAGDVIIDRRGWGAQMGEIEVLDTVAGEPGDYLDMEAPHQVNALVSQSPVTQRGGTRKVQIVGRTPKAGTAVLQLEDAGNLAQTLPTPEGTPTPAAIPVPTFTLAASASAPLTVATATVTNDGDLEDVGASVEWEYAVSASEPVTAGTAFGPLLLGFGVDTIDVPEVPTGSEVWVRARAAIASTGERSAWSAWASITLGPDDDGTGGTLPPFLLALEIDASGALSASATSTVAAITTVYFVAGAAGGAAPAYADVLAGSVDSAGPPFTASSLATMAEGEVRTVGAIGEDALGNRTTLILASITRAVDTGSGAGTPGNLTLTLIASAPNVVRNIGASLAEPKIAKRARKYVNTSNIALARLQGSIHAAASEGTEIHWVYSLDAFATAPIETGVFMRADRVNFPEPGGFLALDALAVGPNVCTGWALKGGDGDAVLKVSDLFVDAVSSDAPPDSPSGDASDLPQGGPLGNIVFDGNPLTLADTLSDNDPVTAWPDDSPQGNDGAPYTTGGTQSAPTFKATGFPGGLPCVRVAGLVEGIAIPPPTTDACSMYIVIGNVTGDGADGTAGAPIMSSAGTTGSNFWCGVQADGDVTGFVNSSVGTPNLDEGATDRSGAGPHLVQFIWDRGNNSFYVYVDDTIDATFGDATISNFWGGIARWYIGNINGVAAKLFADFGRVVVYDRAHVGAVRAPVKAALATQWGTP